MNNGLRKRTGAASFMMAIARKWPRRSAASVLIAAVLTGVASLCAAAQTAQDIDARTRQALLLGLQHKYEQALSLAQQTLPIAEQTLGPDHPLTLRSVSALGAIYLGLRRHDEAESLFRRAYEGRKRVLGNDHPDTIFSTSALVSFIGKGRGRLREAEAYHRGARGGRARMAAMTRGRLKSPQTWRTTTGIGVG